MVVRQCSTHTEYCFRVLTYTLNPFVHSSQGTSDTVHGKFNSIIKIIITIIIVIIIIT